VEEQKYEEIENRVYKAYSKCYDPSSDQSYCKLKFWNITSIWCMKLFYKDKNLLYKDEDKKLIKIFNGMGDEIYLAVDRILKKDKMPKEKFLIYFRKALVNAKNGSVLQGR